MIQKQLNVSQSNYKFENTNQFIAEWMPRFFQGSTLVGAFSYIFFFNFENYSKNFDFLDQLRIYSLYFFLFLLNYNV